MVRPLPLLHPPPSTPNLPLHQLLTHSPPTPHTRIVQAGGEWEVQVLVDPHRALYHSWGLGLSSTWYAVNPLALWHTWKLGTEEGIWCVFFFLLCTTTPSLSLRYDYDCDSPIPAATLPSHLTSLPSLGYLQSGLFVCCVVFCRLFICSLFTDEVGWGCG